ncbi:uncharacterized protein LOC111712330 [Eurytemora carolleeae]|uniref:uncharacterized protein LOC111712330 n=1 Tax=Eurytemora carolleeae TaxID=1294199 RepID=UPI000C76F14A|nr:uncharacterized protein LOC111712330 [Eurytemora carolleeae]|eukprot:XP_023342673.1 uncharacterized protein LOC111712330 [Eurytemora affinis]
MLVSLVSIFILTVGLGATADGLLVSQKMRPITVSAELQEEFRKLNRYCSSYGSSYSSGYSYSNYRPSSYSGYSNYRPSSYYYPQQQQQTSPLSGLGSLVGPFVTGAAVGTGASLLGSFLGVGK